MVVVNRKLFAVLLFRLAAHRTETRLVVEKPLVLGEADAEEAAPLGEPIEPCSLRVARARFLAVLRMFA